MIVLHIFSIDASHNRRFGRYINDSKYANSVPKVVADGEKQLFVCIFAVIDIDDGMEIRYDYKDSNLSWRKDVSLFLLILPSTFLKPLVLEEEGIFINSQFQINLTYW